MRLDSLVSRSVTMRFQDAPSLPLVSRPPSFSLRVFAGMFTLCSGVGTTLAEAKADTTSTYAKTLNDWVGLFCPRARFVTERGVATLRCAC